MNAGPEFEREYFETKSSYGRGGGYSRMAKTARSFYAEYFRIARRAIRDLFDGNGRRAIELGCAFGAGSQLLDDFGWKVTATDVSAYACEKARACLPARVEVRQFDASCTPAPDTTYDLVVAIQVIEHVAGDAFVKGLARLVAPGGHAIVATPNPRSVSPYRRFQADPTHINEQPPGHWCHELRGCGLNILQSKVYHVIPILSRLALRYIRVPEFLGYDTIIVAKRPVHGASLDPEDKQAYSAKVAIPTQPFSFSTQ